MLSPTNLTSCITDLLKTKMHIVADVGSLFIFVDYIRLYLVHRRHNYIIANNGIIGNCFSEVFAPEKQVVFVGLRVSDVAEAIDRN